jgi:ribosomal protein L7/L12
MEDKTVTLKFNYEGKNLSNLVKFLIEDCGAEEVTNVTGVDESEIYKMVGLCLKPGEGKVDTLRRFKDIFGLDLMTAKKYMDEYFEAKDFLEDFRLNLIQVPYKKVESNGN